jgi:hypothetical protein
MEKNVETEAGAVSAGRLVLAKLESQLKAARRQREALSKKRRPLALDAQFDGEARRDLDLLTEEQRKLDAEIGDVGLALDEARDRLAAAEQAARDADADGRVAEARKIEAECLDHASKFDAHLLAAATELRACEECRKRIAKTGTLDVTFLNRLASKSAVQHAVAATDLSKFFDHVGASGRMTLHQSVKGALSAIRRPIINGQALLKEMLDVSSCSTPERNTA